jgi:hypothetical protein
MQEGDKFNPIRNFQNNYRNLKNELRDIWEHKKEIRSSWSSKDHRHYISASLSSTRDYSRILFSQFN